MGLGNIQRFPYLVSQEGGAAFVLVYLLCVIFLGIPLILLEFSLGRNAKSNPYSAIKKLYPKSWFRFAGLLGVFCSFAILSYYIIATGWTLAQVVFSLQNKSILFYKLSSTPSLYWPYSMLSLFFIFIVVCRGIQSGIEKLCKILMPSLIILMFGFFLYALSLADSMKGIKFFLQPDFSHFSFKTILLALGQAFFSLSIGEAVLTVYGSYTDNKTNLPLTGLWIAIFDVGVALLAGLMIFPALYSIGQPQTFQGVGMLYDAIPVIFSNLPYSFLWSALFFMILFFAAITTCVGLFEIPVVFLMEACKFSRFNAALCIFILITIFSFPIGLSHGASIYLSELRIPYIPGKGLYELMDSLWGGLGCTVSGLLMALFLRNRWGIKNGLSELKVGSSVFFQKYISHIWAFLFQWIIPPILIIILVSLFFQ